MELCSACFGGDLVSTRLAETPMKDQLPVGQHQKIVNAHLKSAAIEFFGNRLDAAHPDVEQGNKTAMYVSGARFAELREIFDKLSDGADKDFLVELRDMPFAASGRLTDRYGVEWFFQEEKAA